ncbi:platelet glycoprotein V-like [Cottoperca gobio]|uniref:Platelet glycoprotein V-like n=1 Tax=Cottoperca gobio TaxID=56716 RepID=A0A6J2P8K6_COTGO|nr:platelet glycoprotein V-like [Cottoperca gobio]
MKSRCVLAFLWLAYFCHGTLCCPPLCKCYRRRAEVVCNDVPLTEYPSAGLPKNTTMLTIQFTNITSISEQQLYATPLLQALHLYKNHLRSLSPNLLSGVPFLNTLDLTGNKLRDLPADIFNHAPLRNLVLKNNLIEEVKAEWLPDNSSINWLDLSGNNLTKVPVALFQKLPHLDNLDLANNRLEKIAANSLDTLTKLERLNLRNNKLDTLDASLLQNTRNLNYLLLSMNKFNKLPHNLFQELTQLKHLSLEDNQLSHIPAGLLEPLSSLDEEGLDLSNNPWMCDGKLVYLQRWLQKNNKTVFLPETIICAGPQSLMGRSVMSLRERDLNLHALKMNLWMLLTFTALAECAHSCPDLCSCSFPPSGAEVVCSQSSLTHFPEDGLPSNTTRLSIQSTNLCTITATHLSAVPLLNDLQLYHNNLTSLPSDLLKDVPHLNTLDLTGNHLVHLPPNVFSHASLRSLVLRNNLIEEAHAEWTPGNSSLTWLDLSGNRLTDVPVALLQKLPNLENLDLSDNNLHDLQPDALKNLHRLETVNLAGNKLRSLKPTMFTHNPKLSQLFLQENRLQELPATLLQGLQRLDLLLLNQNQMQHLPPGLLDETKSSFRIILTGNPWACDEKMEYLWKWLTVHPQNVLFLEKVKCAAPEALKQQQVISLTDIELGLHKIQNE